MKTKKISFIDFDVDEIQKLVSSNSSRSVVPDTDSPFTLVDILNDDDIHNVFIFLGNNLVSNKCFSSVDLAKSYIDSKPYDLIIATFFAINNFNSQKS